MRVTFFAEENSDADIDSLVSRTSPATPGPASPIHQECTNAEILTTPFATPFCYGGLVCFAWLIVVLTRNNQNVDNSAVPELAIASGLLLGIPVMISTYLFLRRSWDRNHTPPGPDIPLQPLPEEIEVSPRGMTITV